MTNAEIAKLVAKITLMFGSSKIVNSIVRNQVPLTTLSPPMKVAVLGTSFVLGGMLTEATYKSAAEKIDEIDDILKGKKAVKF